MKNKLSTLVVAMIPAGIALNWVANSIVEMLKLPLFLNNIGNVLNAIVLGPWWGVATAVLTNLVIGLTTRWTIIPFALVGAVVALLGYWFFKKGFFKSIPKVIAAGAITGVIASALGSAVAVYVFGGFAGAGVDILTAGLVAMGNSIAVSNLIANFPGTFLDKILTFWVVFSILRIFPVRFLPNAKKIQEGLGMNKGKKKDDKAA
ncbi:hypothetical protein [Aquibacillus albus]|uniref:Energy-coupling factor transport system substrate-specific component n=1 Tax=Aquibacillus albus TaxID=1168171 RepID=A0ABS2MXW2_9BACI|nr:hypothetical protein [Aquibacillus albus]MBM7570725.1 energy-coupling factor transport system substrate-specific component [Aquibacillus albus]